MKTAIAINEYTKLVLFAFTVAVISFTILRVTTEVPIGYSKVLMEYAGPVFRKLDKNVSAAICSVGSNRSEILKISDALMILACVSYSKRSANSSNSLAYTMVPTLRPLLKIGNAN